MLRKLFTIVLTPLATAGFVTLLLLERRRPLRREVGDKVERAVTNLELGAVTGIIIQILFLPAITRTSRVAAERGLGLLHRLHLPTAVALPLAVLLLDYSYYWWHRMLHQIPLFWRFHLVHHTDVDLDVTTAIRFHFGEWILSTPFRMLQVVAIGASEPAVAIFEITMLLSILFHHSNVRLPVALERALNRGIVTPRMHGIHHSVIERESNSNFATLLSGWDRLHRTLRLDIPQEQVVIGVPAHRDRAGLTIAPLLRLPFEAQPDPWRLPARASGPD